MNEVNNRGYKRFLKPALISFFSVFFLFYLIAIFWSIEPDVFDVRTEQAYRVKENEQTLVVGYTTINTLIRIADELLTKSGGFISNDVVPPGVFMDNMPGWELGVLTQVRDMARVLRKDMSRSQSQSVEQDDLKEVQPKFNIDRNKWMFPSAENEYREGIEGLENYLQKLADSTDPNTQFYARADNLREWLRDVEKQLGSLSQRLAASVGQERINVDLAGEAAATQSTRTLTEISVKTPWWEIDDVFYEARGACWALIHLLRAIDIDFAETLDKKNAATSLRQIIRELEATQQTVWSPMILNGSGFGLFANHSLVMASYISRANAGVIDLRELLGQG
ncbi:MAG: DUF2333 family protein [Pseudomonadota bacterium]